MNFPCDRDTGTPVSVRSKTTVVNLSIIWPWFLNCLFQSTARSLISKLHMHKTATLPKEGVDPDVLGGGVMIFIDEISISFYGKCVHSTQCTCSVMNKVLLHMQNIVWLFSFLAFGN